MSLVLKRSSSRFPFFESLYERIQRLNVLRGNFKQNPGRFQRLLIFFFRISLTSFNSSSGIPISISFIMITATSSPLLSSTVILPLLGINLKALSRRFISTCFKRFWSAFISPASGLKAAEKVRPCFFALGSNLLNNLFDLKRKVKHFQTPMEACLSIDLKNLITLNWPLSRSLSLEMMSRPSWKKRSMI